MCWKNSNSTILQMPLVTTHFEVSKHQQIQAFSEIHWTTAWSVASFSFARHFVWNSLSSLGLFTHPKVLFTSVDWFWHSIICDEHLEVFCDPHFLQCASQSPINDGDDGTRPRDGNDLGLEKAHLGEDSVSANYLGGFPARNDLLFSW